MSADRLTAALADRYTIERELGAGGMATVYLAHDLKHDRDVAIKVLHPDLGAALGAERFLSEIRTTARLQHPHILPLLDSGDAGGLLYYVMPLVTGETLRARLERERQLPINDAVLIAREVADALGYAHGLGVIHRDIKPENILLQGGHALVADFGIALAVQSAAGQRMTQTGLSLGTPQYMSPEQAMGERAIDARSDIYALGAVTYEMLVGEPPFTGPSVQAIVARIMTEKPRSIVAQRDRVTESIDDAVQTALEKLPADRFATAQAFADALQRTDTGRRLAAHASDTNTRRVRWVWPIITAVAVASALWFALHRGTVSHDLQIARQLTFDGNVTLAAITPDGTSLAYVTDDCLGQMYACNLTLRVRDVDGTQSVAIAKSWRTITDIKWSPTGATLAISGSPDSTAASVYLTDKLGGSLRPLHVAVTAMAFTPDGRQLMVASSGQRLVRYDLASLAAVDSTPAPAGWSFSDLSYSPTGDQFIATANRISDDRHLLALFTSDGRVVDSVDMEGGRRSARWTSDGAAVLQFVFSPGIADNLLRVPIVGKRINAAGAEIVLGQVPTAFLGALDVAATGRVALVAAQTGEEVQLWRGAQATPPWRSLTSRTGFLEPWSISPDGRFVVADATDNLSDNIVLIPLDSAGVSRAVTASRGEREYPVMSPDGNRVAYRSYSRATAHLVMASASGGSERDILAGASRQFAWMGDSALVAMRADTIVIVDTNGTIRRRTLVAAAPLIARTSTLVKDPGGPGLAYWSDAASAVVIVDIGLATSRVVANHQSPLTPLGWGRDGSLYLYGVDDETEAHGRVRHRRVIRIPGGSGAPIPFMELPAYCTKVVIDTDARHVVCTVERFKSDVWLADKAGKSGW